MRRFLLALPIAVALTVTAGAALAATDVIVPLNGSIQVPLRGTAANVVIGDPAVADVSMTNAHSLTLLGRGYGATRVTVTDHHGRTLLASRVSVAPPDDGRITYYKGVESHEFTCLGTRCLETGAGPAPVSSLAAPAAPSSETIAPTAAQPPAAPGRERD